MESQTLDLQLESSVMHHVANISGSVSQSPCGWPVITKECFSVFMLIKTCSFYLQNSHLLVWLYHKPLLIIFTGHIDNDKCNTWSLEATTISRCVKAQHIKGIANVLADSVSRLRAVSLYHDLNYKKLT